VAVFDVHPPTAVQVVAPTEVQEIVEVLPLITLSGYADRLTIVAVVTETVALTGAETFPLASRQVIE
jgi:hypothetical protein